MVEVKAFIQMGNMRKPRWVCGKLIDRTADVATVELYGEVHTLESRLVKTYRRIDTETVYESLSKNWDDLKQIVKAAVDKFIPNADELVFNDEEMTISYHDVEIGPTTVERESIAQFVEVPSWGVVYWKTIPATRHEPEDVSDVSCGDSPNIVGAARLFVDTIQRLSADDYWENVSYSLIPDYSDE